MALETKWNNIKSVYLGITKIMMVFFCLSATVDTRECLDVLQTTRFNRSPNRVYCLCFLWVSGLTLPSARFAFFALGMSPVAFFTRFALGIPALILFHAILAIIAQPVDKFIMFIELTSIFPLFAFTAPLFFWHIFLPVKFWLSL